MVGSWTAVVPKKNCLNDSDFVIVEYFFHMGDFKVICVDDFKVNHGGNIS